MDGLYLYYYTYSEEQPEKLLMITCLIKCLLGKSERERTLKNNQRGSVSAGDWEKRMYTKVLVKLNMVTNLIIYP